MGSVPKIPERMRVSKKTENEIEETEEAGGHVHGPNCSHGHHHHTQAPVVRQAPKVGRNDPCPCGSNKKYKKCCLGK